MDTEKGRNHYAGMLTVLILCALLLSARVCYLFLADAQRFPINTVKIAASYQHISHKQLEVILSRYSNDGFIFFPTQRLRADLSGLDWTSSVQIDRIWPDTLKITLVERVPMAVWNTSMMTSDGELFNIGTAADKEQIESTLPHLSGPEQQKIEILQNYQKLSKLLTRYGLHATSLQLRDNQAWELSLSNGVQLHLGKRDLEARLQRFCRAYPAVFAEKPEQLASVDLRYARGMAVQWKQQTGR